MTSNVGELKMHPEFPVLGGQEWHLVWSFCCCRPSASTDRLRCLSINLNEWRHWPLKPTTTPPSTLVKSHVELQQTVFTMSACTELLQGDWPTVEQANITIWLVTLCQLFHLPTPIGQVNVKQPKSLMNLLVTALLSCHYHSAWAMSLTHYSHYS